MTRDPALLICMGVSGAGKSTVAAHLERELGLAMIEADDFHGEANRARMAAGLPLDDSMREPWITRICAELETLSTNHRDCVMACSGLRKAHRERFRDCGFRTLFLHLSGDRETIAGRMKARTGHFYPESLLDSQFADLDPCDDEADIVVVDVTDGLPAVLASATALARAHVAQ